MIGSDRHNEKDIIIVAQKNGPEPSKLKNIIHD